MLSYKDVLRAIEANREAVLSGFRGDRNRWTRADWRYMADAITRLEDELEHKKGKIIAQNRAKLREIRRKLEVMVGD